MRVRLLDLSIYDGKEFEIPDGLLVWEMPEPVNMAAAFSGDIPPDAPLEPHRRYVGLHPSVHTPRQAEEGGVVFIWEGLREPLKRLWGKEPA